MKFYGVSLLSSTPVLFYAVHGSSIIVRGDEIVSQIRHCENIKFSVSWASTSRLVHVLSNFPPFVIFSLSCGRPRSKGSGIQ